MNTSSSARSHQGTDALQNARISELTQELRAIRPRYLSTALPQRRRHIATAGDSHDRSRPLTNIERDEFDAQSKLLLRQLNGAISGLQQAEDVRKQAHDSVALSKRARGGLGGLGRWAAGGAITAKSPEEELEQAQAATLAEVRGSILHYLQKGLERASRAQTDMMDVRLNRELEKSKSILANSAMNGRMSTVQGDYTNSARATDIEAETSTAESGGNAPGGPLTQEQRQQFAEENHALLKHYEDQLDQVRTAERSILEISEMHSTLHASLQQQSEHIDQLVQDSFLTSENVGRGNKELKKASERKSTAQALFYSTVAFCSFLVIWDIIF
jgi:hypothetical protein